MAADPSEKTDSYGRYHLNIKRGVYEKVYFLMKMGIYHD
jgi:hypothetical protein